MSTIGESKPVGDIVKTANPSAETAASQHRYSPYALSYPIPVLLRLPGERSLLLKAPLAARETAVLGIQSLLLRLLASIPPGKMRFTFFDPLGLGQNVAPFIHLADYDEQLVTARAWSERIVPRWDYYHLK